MANVKNGNTIYVDTTGSILTGKQVKVTHVVVTATASNAVVVLSDDNASNLKLDLRVEISGHSELFNFAENPAIFPNGLRCTTLTNAKATIFTTSAGG